MIAVDTSALLAIVFDEPERNDYKRALQRATKALISTISVVEAKIVVHNRRSQAGDISLDNLLSLPIFEVVPPGMNDTHAAYNAFVIYGKGNGHPANLNFGDLFSYALAKVRDLPLLFKGNDFIHTDIQAAMES